MNKNWHNQKTKLHNSQSIDFYRKKYNNFFLQNIRNNDQEQKIFVSTIFLIIKISFFVLAFVSLFKVGYIAKIRITRLREIKNSYLYETSRYEQLSKRFDSLFEVKGEQRFMKDQNQMISRDILRVIWR